MRIERVFDARGSTRVARDARWRDLGLAGLNALVVAFGALLLMLAEPGGLTRAVLTLGVAWCASQILLSAVRLVVAPRQVAGRVGSLYVVRARQGEYLVTPPGIDLARFVSLDRVRLGFTIGSRRGRAVLVAPKGQRLLEFAAGVHPSDVAESLASMTSRRG